MNFHTTAPTVSAPTISSASMLVELSISVWTGRKKDRAASDDVTRMNHANVGVASVNKKLLGDCEELVSIQKFAANVRSSHYAMTMPWSDSGLRLLPTKQFFGYNQQITALQTEFDTLVEAFLSAYDWEVMQAQTKLGNLFIRDEYPTTESLRDKFGFRVNYVPLADINDWRVDMEQETIRSLKEQYTAFYQKQTEGAMRDVFERLHAEVARFIKQLDVDADGKKGKIYQSTIDHVHSLTDMMDMANFTKDPGLSLAVARLRSALNGVTQADLKKDEFLREDTKRAMEQAIAALPSLM